MSPSNLTRQYFFSESVQRAESSKKQNGEPERKDDTDFETNIDDVNSEDPESANKRRQE